MKKIVYLLLISLLFASCKKNENKAETNALLLKGKWKIQAGKKEYYDAAGNLIDTKYSEEPEPEDFFYMEFDGNNQFIYNNFDNSNEKIGFYTYQNGYLNFSSLDNEIKMSVFVSQLTPNNMTWQAEPAEPDEPEEDNPDNLDFPDLIQRPIVKTVLCFFHFDKV